MLPALHNDNTYFHQNRRSRVNNPTFVSTYMTDSLTNVMSQTVHKQANKETEYKQNFERSNDENRLSIHSMAKSSNFAKFSQQAFQKNRSTMSNYGANILGQSNKPIF